MMIKEITLEKFQKIINETNQKGETGLLIWKDSKERDKWGKNEESMWVENAFEPHGYIKYGKAYGEYRNMELTRAIRNAFNCETQFKLLTKDGNNIAAMAFKIENLLSLKGHFMFAYRSMLYKHLNGPIISIPSYKVVKW